MTSTYDSIKNILGIDGEISRGLIKTNFRDEKIEKHFFNFNEKIIENNFVLVSFFIIFLNLIKLIYEIQTLGLNLTSITSVLICLFDFTLVIYVYYCIRNKNKNISRYMKNITYFRTSLLIINYIYSIFLFYFSGKELMFSAIIKLIYLILIIKSFAYVFVFPENIIYALALFCSSFVVIIFIILHSNATLASNSVMPYQYEISNLKQFTLENNYCLNNSVSTNNSLLDNLNYGTWDERNTNRLLNETFDDYNNQEISNMFENNATDNNKSYNSYLNNVKSSIGYFEILIEILFFICSICIKKFTSYTDRRTYLEKYKFKKFFKYSDQLISGLNGCHISFLNKDLIYMNKNFKQILINNKLILLSEYKREKANLNNDDNNMYNFNNQLSNNSNINNKSHDLNKNIESSCLLINKHAENEQLKDNYKTFQTANFPNFVNAQVNFKIKKDEKNEIKIDNFLNEDIKQCLDIFAKKLHSCKDHNKTLYEKLQSLTDTKAKSNLIEPFPSSINYSSQKNENNNSNYNADTKYYNSNNIHYHSNVNLNNNLSNKNLNNNHYNINKFDYEKDYHCYRDNENNKTSGLSIFNKILAENNHANRKVYNDRLSRSETKIDKNNFCYKNLNDENLVKNTFRNTVINFNPYNKLIKNPNQKYKSNNKIRDYKHRGYSNQISGINNRSEKSLNLSCLYSKSQRLLFSYAKKKNNINDYNSNQINENTKYIPSMLDLKSNINDGIKRNYKSNLNKNSTIISNHPPEVQNRKLLHLTRTFTGHALNLKEQTYIFNLKNKNYQNKNYDSDDENKYDNKSLDSNQNSSKYSIKSFMNSKNSDKKITGNKHSRDYNLDVGIKNTKNIINDYQTNTNNNNLKTYKNTAHLNYGQALHKECKSCENSNDENTKKDYQKIITFNHKKDDRNSIDDNNLVNHENQKKNNLIKMEDNTINNTHEINNFNSNFNLLSHDKNVSNNDILLENLNNKNNQNQTIDKISKSMRNKNLNIENKINVEHSSKNLLKIQKKTLENKNNNKNDKPNKASNKPKEKDKVFALLGQYYIELNKETKYFQVYYRKINSILDIIFYDCTKIVVAETISSENKIKHKLLSKIAHEFKTPLNNIIGLVNNLKSAFTKNYKVEKDLNLIHSLSNYTIYLISDVIQYASNDNYSNNNVDKSYSSDNIISNAYSIKGEGGNYSNSNLNIDSSTTIVDKNPKTNINIFFRQVDIKKCLFFCFDILNALISCNEMKKRSVSTELRIDDRVRFVSLISDEIRINQILINFISNAVKFTRNGKILIIANLIEKNSLAFNSNNKLNTNKHAYENNAKGNTLQSLSPQKNINISSNNDNNKNIIKNKDSSGSNNTIGYFLKISIVDTGTGISYENQKELFNDKLILNTKYEFNHQGSGLGLSICLNLIKLLNIRIEFCSKENLGSAFSIVIPINLNNDSSNNTNIFYSKQQILPSSGQIHLINQSNSSTNKSGFAKNFRTYNSLKSKNFNSDLNSNKYLSGNETDKKNYRRNNSEFLKKSNIETFSNLNLFKNGATKKSNISEFQNENVDNVQILHLEESGRNLFENYGNKIFLKNSSKDLKRSLSYDNKNINLSKMPVQNKIPFLENHKGKKNDKNFDKNNINENSIKDTLIEKRNPKINFNSERKYSIETYSENKSIHEKDCKIDFNKENYKNIQSNKLKDSHINCSINPTTERKFIDTNYFDNSKIKKSKSILDKEPNRFNITVLLADDDKKLININDNLNLNKDKEDNEKDLKDLDAENNLNNSFTLTQKFDNQTIIDNPRTELVLNNNQNVNDNANNNIQDNDDADKSIESTVNSLRISKRDLNEKNVVYLNKKNKLFNNKKINSNDNLKLTWFNSVIGYNKLNTRNNLDQAKNSENVFNYFNLNNNNPNSDIETNINKKQDNSLQNNCLEKENYGKKECDNIKPNQNIYLNYCQTMQNVRNQVNKRGYSPYTSYAYSDNKNQNISGIENLNQNLTSEITNKKMPSDMNNSESMNNYYMINTSNNNNDKDDIRFKYSSSNNTTMKNSRNKKYSAYKYNANTVIQKNNKFDLNLPSSGSIKFNEIPLVSKDNKVIENFQSEYFFRGMIINTFDFQLINDLRQNKFDSKNVNYLIYRDEDNIYLNTIMKTNSIFSNTGNNTLTNTLLGFNLNSNNNLFKTLNSINNSPSNYNNKTDNLKMNKHLNSPKKKQDSYKNIISNNNYNPINTNYINDNYNLNNLNKLSKGDKHVKRNEKANETYDEEFLIEKNYSRSFSNSNLDSKRFKQADKNNYLRYHSKFSNASCISKLNEIASNFNNETMITRRLDDFNLFYKYPDQFNSICSSNKNNSESNIVNLKENSYNDNYNNQFNILYNNNYNLDYLNYNRDDSKKSNIINSNNAISSVGNNNNNNININFNRDVRSIRGSDAYIRRDRPLIENTEIYYNYINNTNNMTNNTNTNTFNNNNNSFFSGNTHIDRGFTRLLDQNNTNMLNSNNYFSSNINNNNINRRTSNLQMANPNFNNSISSSNANFLNKNNSDNYQSMNNYNNINNNIANQSQIHKNIFNNSSSTKNFNETKSLFRDRKLNEESNFINYNLNNIGNSNINEMGNTQILNLTNDLNFSSRLNNNLENVNTNNFRNIFKNNFTGSSNIFNNANLINLRENYNANAENSNNLANSNTNNQKNEMKDTEFYIEKTLIDNSNNNIDNQNKLNNLLNLGNTNINKNDLIQFSFNGDNSKFMALSKNNSNSKGCGQFVNNENSHRKNSFNNIINLKESNITVSKNNINNNTKSNNSNKEIYFKRNPKKFNSDKDTIIEENEILQEKQIYIYIQNKFNPQNLILDKTLEFSLISEMTENEVKNRGRKSKKTRKSQMPEVKEINHSSSDSKDKSYDSNKKVDILELYNKKRKQYEKVISNNNLKNQLEKEKKSEKKLNQKNDKNSNLKKEKNSSDQNKMDKAKNNPQNETINKIEHKIDLINNKNNLENNADSKISSLSKSKIKENNNDKSTLKIKEIKNSNKEIIQTKKPIEHEITEEKKLFNMKMEPFRTLTLKSKNMKNRKKVASRYNSSNSSSSVLSKASESLGYSRDDSKSKKFSSNSIDKKEKTLSNKKLEDQQFKKSSSKVNNINIYSNFTCCCNNNNNNQINKNSKKNLVEDIDLNSNKFIFLVIDDNVYIRKSIANLINNTLKALKKKDNFSTEFEIIEGSDGIDALKLVIDPKIGRRIKAIFIDENMEYLNGSETVRLIRNFQKLNKINKFHIASVTAFEDPVTRQSVLNAGVNEIFPKPLSKSHLLDFFKRYQILVS